MSTTQNTYTGNGSTRDFILTFPHLTSADVRVSLDEIGTTEFELLNATTVRFDTAPANNVAIRIYRVTDDSNNKIVFSSGSTVKADDLNDAVNRNLYIAQETTNNLSSVTAGGVSDGSLTTSKLADTAVIDAKISNLNVTRPKIANNAINSDKLDTGAVTTNKISDDAVDDTKLSDTAVTAGSYTNTSISVNAQGRITSASSGDGFAAGMIMMFTGTTAPSGWVFCDGNNQTPDLRDKFIVGADPNSSDDTYPGLEIGQTGGSPNAVLIAHSHSYRRTAAQEGVQTDNDDYLREDTETIQTGITGINADGESDAEQTGTNANLPPYYALAFIMKT